MQKEVNNMSATYRIIKARNGFSITRKYDDEDVEETVVGVETEDEIASFMEFLSAINFDFGPSTSRYEAERIHIVAIPGDKFEGKLSKEQLENLKELKEMIDNALEGQ